MEDAELTTLKQRMRAGNEKLITSWPRIWDIPDEEERAEQLKRWDEANRLLDALCMELMYRFDFHDCLYLENGRKTKPCTDADGFCCFACPSDKPYWHDEERKREEDYDF